MRPNQIQANRFKYLRWKLWAPSRYTKSEKRELILLRKTYTECLQHKAFPALIDTPLAICAADHIQPKHTASDFSFFIPQHDNNSGHLFNTATSAMQLIRQYYQQRNQRFFRKGYDNDPNRLLCALLMKQFQRLATVCCNQDTQVQITQLKTWLSRLMIADQGRPILRNERQKGDQTLSVLLCYLINSLDLMAHQTQRYCAQKTAREQFDTLQKQMMTLLSNLVKYLFYSASNAPRTSAFSLTNASILHDRSVKKALDCLEGNLLKHIIHYPDIQNLLDPNGSYRKVHHYLGKPKSIFLNRPDTDLLTQRGKAHPALVLALIQFDKKRIDNSYHAYLETTASLNEHLKSAKTLLSDDCLQKNSQICKGLSASAADAFVRLHALTLYLGTYCKYVDALWKLAGFGGEKLICKNLGPIVKNLMEEFEAFLAAFEKTFQAFHQNADLCYRTSLDKNYYTQWRINYTLARQSIFEAIKKQWICCEETLQNITKTLTDASLYKNQIYQAKQALEIIEKAHVFSKKVAHQLNLSMPNQQPKRMKSPQKKTTHIPHLSPAASKHTQNLTAPQRDCYKQRNRGGIIKQNKAKKRRLFDINKCFEQDFNAARTPKPPFATAFQIDQALIYMLPCLLSTTMLTFGIIKLVQSGWTLSYCLLSINSTIGLLCIASQSQSSYTLKHLCAAVLVISSLAVCTPFFTGYPTWITPGFTEALLSLSILTGLSIALLHYSIYKNTKQKERLAISPQPEHGPNSFTKSLDLAPPPSPSTTRQASAQENELSNTIAVLDSEFASKEEDQKLLNELVLHKTNNEALQADHQKLNEVATQQGVQLEQIYHQTVALQKEFQTLTPQQPSR